MIVLGGSLAPIDLPALRGDEVHVYCADLTQFQSSIADLAASLDVGETDRARRFRFDTHRDRYVIRRGILRFLLGSLLQLPPEEVRLTAGQHGKPELEANQHDRPLRFNLSSSRDLALYAFARGRNLGVDVEFIRDDVDHLALADRYFTRVEREALASADSQHLAGRFFACWTRKEAVVKAHGAGLSLPLDSFEVSVLAESNPRLEWVSEDPRRDWRLVNLDVAPGYAAALAVVGPPWSARVWQLSWTR